MGCILVVDDNADIRLLLSKALMTKGYQVALAENGLEAQNFLISGRDICVVLLDLMMPVVSGQEFLAWKNGQTIWDDLPVLVISAQPDDSLSGIRGCLKKPVNLKELFLIVNEHCQAS